MRSELIRYLPAIYQSASEHSLLAHLLAAFENILLERDESAPGTRPAVEQLVSGLAAYFDPEHAPANFLPWLAGWAALSLRPDLSESRQREVISRIIPLYAKRGTRRGIREMVELFTGGTIDIEEPPDLEFQIEDHSTIGKDTYLGGPPPHMFHVRFSPEEHGHGDGRHSEEERARRAQLEIAIARAVIDMARPAHTWYTFEVIRRDESAAAEGVPENGEPRYESHRT